MRNSYLVRVDTKGSYQWPVTPDISIETIINLDNVALRRYLSLLNSSTEVSSFSVFRIVTVPELTNLGKLGAEDIKLINNGNNLEKCV